MKNKEIMNVKNFCFNYFYVKSVGRFINYQYICCLLKMKNYD